MNRFVLSVSRYLVAAVATVCLAVVPAKAQSTTVFVSGVGSDNGGCTAAKPCRTFQVAVNAVAPNGEVIALDSANYGPVTITQPVTIKGNGWATITPPAGSNGITINAGATDKVVIRGVSFNGARVSGGANGIVFNSGGSLTVTSCVVQDFAFGGGSTGMGIMIQPTAGTVNFTITNTTVESNAIGIRYIPASGTPSANGVIDHVVSTANSFGIAINTSNATGGTTVVAISNSIASENLTTGINVVSGSATTVNVSLDNVTASGNNNGVVVSGTANVVLGRSVISGNNTGVLNTTSPNAFYSYGNNQINLNGADISGTALNTAFKPQ